jgi:hypothetical protein
MARTFAVNVAVHKSAAESVFFRIGDEVPDWALDKVGDHVFEPVDESDDVRFRDPQYEEDDPETKFSTPITLPPSVEGTPLEEDDEEEVDLDSLSKAELQAEAEARGLDTSGTKAELKERILADLDEE